jgi:hypothetical protein
MLVPEYSQCRFSAFLFRTTVDKSRAPLQSIKAQTNVSMKLDHENIIYVLVDSHIANSSKMTLIYIKFATLHLISAG